MTIFEYLLGPSEIRNPDLLQLTSNHRPWPFFSMGSFLQEKEKATVPVTQYYVHGTDDDSSGEGPKETQLTNFARRLLRLGVEERGAFTYAYFLRSSFEMLMDRYPPCAV